MRGPVEIKLLLSVSEVMSSNVLTLKENASIGRAQAEMKLANIRHFPVVNQKGDVLGMVSSQDVARALGRDNEGKGTAVKELMSTDVLTISEEAPAHLAAKLMRTRKIGSLPVVDATGKLVGIVTESDFLEIAEQALSGRQLRRTRT